ncbi:MAG: hypothetical protein Q9185_004619 [Variospora sp. 1 TL-2023]
MPSPLVSATLKSAFLSLCSALVATFLTPKDPPILALVIYSALATPPNFLWQQFLERTFPGYITEKKEADGDVKGGTPAGGGVTLKRRLNVQNTVMKVIIDQTLGSVVNVALHLGGVRALQGVPLPECWKAVTEYAHHDSAGHNILLAIRFGKVCRTFTLCPANALYTSSKAQIPPLRQGRMVQSQTHFEQPDILAAAYGLFDCVVVG